LKLILKKRLPAIGGQDRNSKIERRCGSGFLNTYYIPKEIDIWLQDEKVGGNDFFPHKSFETMKKVFLVELR